MPEMIEQPGAAERGRNVEIEDLLRFQLLSDVQISPDGQTVAFVQTRLRKKENDYASTIWLVQQDGSRAPLKLTGGEKRDTFPRWSPLSDELAFLSTRSGKPQVWVIPVGGGEARRLTSIRRGVKEFTWSPDGRWLVFSATVDNEQDKELAAREKQERRGGNSDSENRESSAGGQSELVATVLPAAEWGEDAEDEKEAEDKGDHAKVFTRLHMRADGSGLTERRVHLFIVPSAGGTPHQLTEGDWDAASPRWSPDGRTLAFLSNREPDADYVSTQDIFVMPVDDSGKGGEAHRVTHHDLAISRMAWLPSGEGFVVYAHRRINEGAFATNPHVWTITLSGEATDFTQGLDRPVAGLISDDMRSGSGEDFPAFSKDGSRVYFRVTDKGCVHLYSVPLAGGEPKLEVGGEREVLNFGLGRDGIVINATDALCPNDLFVVGTGGAGERRLTNVNGDTLGALRLSRPEAFWLDRPDGGRVQGWIMLPPSHKAGDKHPLVLQIHGGPHMSFGTPYFHEFQLMAARGYVVLYTNPRGSQGYGQDFSDAILSDWGGIDYEDIMACVDYAIDCGYVDESRMGVAGGSYGGYMVTWIIGHSQRFKAAVASRMVSNLYSAWGSGDYTWMLWSWEFEGMPQERTALYLERSPISYVGEMHTPLLITHAVDDLRCSIGQSDQMYTALKVLKREVKMVRLPSGGHDVSRTGKPSLRVERIQHILGWMDEHLQR